MEENVFQIKSGITISVNTSAKKYIWKRLYWNWATCNCENGKYLAGIINDSVITCDEITDVEAKSLDKEKKANFTTNFTRNFTTSFNEKKDL